MPEPKVYEFSKHIGALRVTRGTDVHKLGAGLGVDPMELLRMVNGRGMPTEGRSSLGWRRKSTPPLASCSYCPRSPVFPRNFPTLGDVSTKSRENGCPAT